MIILKFFFHRTGRLGFQGLDGFLQDLDDIGFFKDSWFWLRLDVGFWFWFFLGIGLFDYVKIASANTLKKDRSMKRQMFPPKTPLF
ncbi:MAG: hypothetical protein ABIN57_09355 [Chitinophagaceae bacterium]